jgi:uncharacterized protein YlxW (UPF0749 family)
MTDLNVNNQGLEDKLNSLRTDIVACETAIEAITAKLDEAFGSLEVSGTNVVAVSTNFAVVAGTNFASTCNPTVSTTAGS